MQQMKQITPILRRFELRAARSSRTTRTRGPSTVTQYNCSSLVYIYWWYVPVVLVRTKYLVQRHTDLHTHTRTCTDTESEDDESTS